MLMVSSEIGRLFSNSSKLGWIGLDFLLDARMSVHDCGHGNGLVK